MRRVGVSQRVMVARMRNRIYDLTMTSMIVASAAQGPPWSFGDKLRKVRRDVARVSQATMAGILNVNPATYSAWEGGRSTPPRSHSPTR